MAAWDLPAGGLVKFDMLPNLARFTPAGSIDGIPLAHHHCARPGPARGCSYISAMPSVPGDSYVVPFCGCRPDMESGMIFAAIAQVADTAEALGAADGG